MRCFIYIYMYILNIYIYWILKSKIMCYIVNVSNPCLCVITQNLPRLNYVPFLKILFPTSLCGVLVLCLDPAAAASPSASTRPVPTSSHNTHHCNTYHISLIPAQLHHLSHLTCHTPLITTPPITYTTFHIISLTTYHFSLITPLITTPLLTSHSSHPLITPLIAGPRLPFAWQAQYTEPQSHLEDHFVKHHLSHNVLTHHLAHTTLSNTIFHTTF